MDRLIYLVYAAVFVTTMRAECTQGYNQHLTPVDCKLARDVFRASRLKLIIPDRYQDLAQAFLDAV